MQIAFRQLLKTPGFTVVALLTLALGIGVNTSVFSVLNYLMLGSQPYPEVDRMVQIWSTTPQSRTAISRPATSATFASKAPPSPISRSITSTIREPGDPRQNPRNGPPRWP